MYEQAINKVQTLT